jgi:hypothetical protein
MSGDLTVQNQSNLPSPLAADLAAAINYAKAEKAPATRKAYRTDFRLFEAWCANKSATSLPALPEKVAAYLAAEASAGGQVPQPSAAALPRSGTLTSWQTYPPHRC